MITELTLEQRNLRQRNRIAFFGLCLPVASWISVFFFGRGVNPIGVLSSISATHYSNGYLLFEGLVIYASSVLWDYEGYDIADRRLSKLAAIGGFVLSFFPCSLEGANTWNSVMLVQRVSNIIHLAGALTFFGTLAYIVGFQFPKTGEGMVVQPKSQKWRRNILYRVCFAVMTVSLVVGFGGSRFIGFPSMVFAGESVALVALGIAMLTKGGKIFKDL